jgi:hypothetical protein
MTSASSVSGAHAAANAAAAALLLVAGVVNQIESKPMRTLTAGLVRQCSLLSNG